MDLYLRTECETHHVRKGETSWSLIIIATLLPLAALGQGSEPLPRQPSSPQIQETDVRSLSEDKPVQPWKPGDPVRVMGDLKEDGEQQGSGDNGKKSQDGTSKPIVRKPVAPQVMDKDLSELDKVKPYKPGDPVRVVPDLKEDDSEK